jgi:hypothetical protein
MKPKFVPHIQEDPNSPVVHCQQCWAKRRHHRRVCGRMEILTCTVCGAQQTYTVKQPDFEEVQA